MATSDLMQVEVKAIKLQAREINSYELAPRRPAQELPEFTAGAHIDVHLPNGLIRAYSLINSQGERHRYVIAVAKDAASRGGSRFLHESLHVGDTLTISAPRNNFPLDEDAPHSLLIAGGIGITPLWCMAKRLQQLGRSWELYYCTRTRQHTAFLAPLLEWKEKVHMNLHFNFDAEPGGQMLDIERLVQHAAPATHFYCCGPTPMLDAFEKATSSRPSTAVHVEYFKSKEGPASRGGFTVVLARSGREVFVASGKTILDALLESGIDAPFSCMEGTCGTCETRVISGIPDHRDVFLSKQEHAANDRIATCCSGAKSEKLVLDL